MADKKASPAAEATDEEDAKTDAELEAAVAAARQKKIDRLKHAIAPLEEAAANAHDQAGAFRRVAVPAGLAVVADEDLRLRVLTVGGVLLVAQVGVNRHQAP